ncbi:MAG TPA: ABC transporter permease subunit [Armatimonadota bacterium]|nr:ABC transporter permease subunit [Armatimonadota bacterium]HPO72681.1 ABC transporter permease subunit [Armatimonadota bacterium]HPT98685.1 ABC transporter permease subunit [Armatimonadota bacterium]
MRGRSRGEGKGRPGSRIEPAHSARARRRRCEWIRQAGIHLALLAGCVLFAFPFVWLVTTSFKDEREIAAFPPRWIPRVPHYSSRSPFVDPDYYDEMKRPAGMAPEMWREHRDAIARWLDTCLASACSLHPEALPVADVVTDPTWERALRNGMWDELSRILPDEVAQQPDRLKTFIAANVSAERLRKVATGLSRVCAIGELSLRDARHDRVDSTAESGRWRVVSGAAELGRRVAVEIESGQLLRYDLGAGPVLLERSLYLSRPGALGEWVDSITLGLHSDDSWHRLFLTVETPDAVYRSEEAFWLERASWRDLVWRFSEPDDRTKPVVVLRPDPRARATSLAANEIRLRLRIERTSPLMAAYAKYSLNYRRALRYIPFWRYVGNSVYLVILNILGQVLACSLVAYAFARLRFYGRDVLFALLLATMMLPGQVTMIPVFLIFKSLGWYDTLKPLWVGAWFGSAFYIFLLRQFFLGIPTDLEDAAKIDGCGFFGLYWRIMLPLVRPALATVAIFTFMSTWNDFMGPLIYIGREELSPLALGLFQFRSEHGGEWGMMMAASTLMTLPVVVIFFLAQRYFIQGVTLTGMGGK